MKPYVYMGNNQMITFPTYLDMMLFASDKANVGTYVANGIRHSRSSLIKYHCLIARQLKRRESYA